MTKNTILTKVLDLFAKNATQTPDAINKVAGGKYASKHVLYLKLEGHNIETVKDGRNVVHYVYKGMDDTLDTSVKKSERRAHNFLKTQKKTATPKAEKPAKATKPVVAPKEKVVKAKKMKADRPLMDRIVKSTDIVQETFGSDGTVGSVDPDWDEGVEDVRSLLS